MLPPSTTPLNRHSLNGLESWLRQLGAQRSDDDRCRWTWVLSGWTNEILLAQDELRVTWLKDGQSTSCCFSYGLSRSDVEAAIKQGP